MSEQADKPPEDVKLSRPRWLTTFTALSIRNYRWFWAGNLSSFFAQWMLFSAQGWLAFQLTHSPMLLGLIGAIQGVPQFTFNLFSGVIIDRIQKRDVIKITQAATMINTLVIAVLITTGQIQYWHLAIAAFLNGTINAFNFPARNSIAPELVPKDKIYNAVALNNGAMNTSRVVAPALAGLLIEWIGTQGAYFVAVGCNLIAIFSVSFIPSTSRPGNTARASFLENFKEGIRYLKAHEILLMILGMELVLTVFGVSYAGLIPVFADILQISPLNYGLMLSAVGIGALIGSLSVASLGNFKRKGLLLIIMGIAFGCCLIIFANSGRIGQWLNLGTNVFYLAIVSLMMVGFTVSSYTATSLTIIQMFVTDEVRGRVTSVYQMVTSISVVSYSLAGAMASGLGAPLALTILGGCLAFFMICMAIFNRSVRNLG